MTTKNDLKNYAKKLMFDMSEKEYETLEKEFAFILKQMDKIAQMENIQDVEPLVFPFINEKVKLREDEIGEYLSADEVLANTKHQLRDQVKVPKVVE